LPFFRNRIFRFASVFAVLLLLAGVTTASANAATKTKISSRRTSHSSSKHLKRHHRHSAKSRGQRAIAQDRTREIQAALIREHYLSGEPSGVWDQATKDALVRYQAANGWQTRVTPDSRALIKLGLGPDHKGLLNPATAYIPSPHELGMDSGSQPGGAADQQ
jgi:Putative peptidoglycan binding domain